MNSWEGLDKKIGADRGDPNRHAQPRLPGSVVGEASMPRSRLSYKITEVIALKLPSAQALNYFAATSECVIAWTDSAMRFCTPTFRISLAT
jgi:hypothetical protein